MSAAHTAAAEWRQFRLLSRDATRRMLSTALFSRDADPAGFALWMLALVATPPLLFAVVRGMNYSFLVRASADVLARTVLGDRMFVVIYAMLVGLLVAGLLWDALFPDRAEQEIVGVLPVRPRTLAAARLAAALRLAAICALAVNVPAAAIFTLFAASHPALRAIHSLLAGQVVAGTLACLFVFLALVAVRGIIAATAGARAGNWLGIVLQVVAIVSLVEVFFFLPRLIDDLVRVLRDGGHALWAVPLWFAALLSWVAGDGFTPRPELAAAAGVATLGAAVIVVALYGLSATRVGRRAIEAQERHRRSHLTTIAKYAAHVARSSPRVAGLFVFTTASLARSRQHLVILSAYASLALATIVFRIVAAGMRRPARPGPRGLNAAPERVQYAISQMFADVPTAAQLSIPLLLIFFLVLGLKACFRVPTDAGANWPFRLTPPRPAEAAAAAWLSLVAMGVAPAVIITLVGGGLLWPATTAATAAVLTAATGVLLVEIVLAGWHIVPFACSHEPSADSVRWKWMAGVVALNVFAFGLAGLEAHAIGAVWTTVSYLAIVVAGITIARVRRRRWLTEMTFEEAPERTTTLRLSEALH